MLSLNASLEVAFWGDSCVVFDDASGDTHLLEGDASRILAVLAEATVALTPAQIANRLAQGSTPAVDADRLDEVISELARLGVVATQQP